MCLIIDEKPRFRLTQATPTVYDVTTGSAARKMTTMMMSADAKRDDKENGETTFCAIRYSNKALIIGDCTV